MPIINFCILFFLYPRITVAQRVSEWHNNEPDYIGGGTVPIVPILIGVALGTIIQRLLEKKMGGNEDGTWLDTFFYGLWFVIPLTIFFVLTLVYRL